jgi:hypothetical protein
MAATDSVTAARFLLLLAFVVSCEGFIAPTLPLLARRRISPRLELRLASESVERVKQVVKVNDLVTGIPVYLVGAMHYNPVSIRSAFSLTKNRITPLRHQNTMPVAYMESAKYVRVEGE